MADPMPTPPVAQEHQFLTVAEVAGFLRLSKMTVYRLIHTGVLSSVRVGRSLRIPRTAVSAYLESEQS